MCTVSSILLLLTWYDYLISLALCYSDCIRKIDCILVKSFRVCWFIQYWWIWHWGRYYTPSVWIHTLVLLFQNKKDNNYGFSLLRDRPIMFGEWVLIQYSDLSDRDKPSIKYFRYSCLVMMFGFSGESRTTNLPKKWNCYVKIYWKKL